ncbi:hypothetical protein AAJP47_02010 [Psychrobacter sp. B38]|uniref:hypothetical protein n=1 Tax=Psychrobacter sp. B38 TaxID=3143538 RepID=UPI00320E8527
MSNTNNGASDNNASNDNVSNDSSDVKKAVDHANGEQIEKNLEENKQVDAPEPLSEEEETPFIEDDLRTDK